MTGNVGLMLVVYHSSYFCMHFLLRNTSCQVENVVFVVYHIIAQLFLSVKLHNMKILLYKSADGWKTSCYLNRIKLHKVPSLSLFLLLETRIMLYKLSQSIERNYLKKDFLSGDQLMQIVFCEKRFSLKFFSEIRLYKCFFPLILLREKGF